MKSESIRIIIAICVYEFFSRPLTMWALNKFHAWRKRSNVTVRVADIVGVLVVLGLGVAIAFATVY